MHGFTSSYHPMAHNRIAVLPIGSQRKLSKRWASVEEEKAAPEPNVASVGPNTSSDATNDSTTPFYKFPKAAYKIYTTYARRLWKETGVSARKQVANDKVRGAIRSMQHILVHAKEYAEFDEATYEAQLKLMTSCEEMLTALPEPETQVETKKKKATSKAESTALESTNETIGPEAAPPKKKQRSVLFGALMGLTVALWVFSGSYIFTGLFCLMSILGQLEYYRMVMNTGVYAARRISIVGASSMFLTVSRQTQNDIDLKLGLYLTLPPF